MSINRQPTVRQRRLGRVLKELRLAAEMTQPEAAEVLRCTEGKISRIENAQSGIREIDLVLLLDAYGIEDRSQRDALASLRREGRVRGWWTRRPISRGYADYAALESDASEISDVEVTLVPGLLQTDAYTRAIVEAQIPDVSAGRVEELVAVRAERRKILRRDSPVSFRAVVSEAALKHVIGSTAVMREQLLALTRSAEESNVGLRVLPESSGAHAALFGPFVILSFPEAMETDVVYLEGLRCAIYLEEPEEVQKYCQLFQKLTTESLPPDESRQVISRIAATL